MAPSTKDTANTQIPTGVVHVCWVQHGGVPADNLRARAGYPVWVIEVVAKAGGTMARVLPNNVLMNVCPQADGTGMVHSHRAHCNVEAEPAGVLPRLLCG